MNPARRLHYAAVTHVWPSQISQAEAVCSTSAHTRALRSVHLDTIRAAHYKKHTPKRSPAHSLEPTQISVATRPQRRCETRTEKQRQAHASTRTKVETQSRIVTQKIHSHAHTRAQPHTGTVPSTALTPQSHTHNYTLSQTHTT